MITLLAICGLNHKQSYFDIFMVAVTFPPDVEHPGARDLRDVWRVLRGESQQVRLIVLLAAMLAPPAARAAELRLLAAELPPYTFQVPPATVSESPGVEDRASSTTW